MRRAGVGLVALAALLVVAGCASPPARRAPEPVARPAPTPGVATATPPKRSGGYYLDDGPGDHPPPNLDLLPDAVPKVEKPASGANRPYNVFGVDYVPDLSGAPYRQRGVGSWYGRKFHGQRTSSGEIYDMYAMTAAHPTLPIPCYALVTNVQNGRSVIVRVNDRGPFLYGRVMDLSYAAATKLGYLSSGSGTIDVELLLPADIAAGRIPITTNSLLVASNAGGRSASPAATIATESTTKPVGSAVPASALPIVAPPPLPAGDAADTRPTSTADRGIPADLIPDLQPAAKVPEIATNAGFFLQLGAFRVRTSADSFAAHLAREIDPALASKVHVADTNGLFRVRVGPYAQRTDADTAATTLRASIAQPVLVMPEGQVR